MILCFKPQAEAEILKVNIKIMQVMFKFKILMIYYCEKHSELNSIYLECRARFDGYNLSCVNETL